MKACPLCKSTYEDWIDFCFNDGMPLVARVEAAEPPAARVPEPAPRPVEPAPRAVDVPAGPVVAPPPFAPGSAPVRPSPERADDNTVQRLIGAPVARPPLPAETTEEALADVLDAPPLPKGFGGPRPVGDETVPLKIVTPKGGDAPEAHAATLPPVPPLSAPSSLTETMPLPRQPVYAAPASTEKVSPVEPVVPVIATPAPTTPVAPLAGTPAPVAAAPSPAVAAPVAATPVPATPAPIPPADPPPSPVPPLAGPSTAAATEPRPLTRAPARPAEDPFAEPATVARSGMGMMALLAVGGVAAVAFGGLGIWWWSSREPTATVASAPEAVHAPALAPPPAETTSAPPAAPAPEAPPVAAAPATSPAAPPTAAAPATAPATTPMAAAPATTAAPAATTTTPATARTTSPTSLATAPSPFTSPAATPSTPTTAAVEVAPAAAVEERGTLRVQSQPDGATVYVDDVVKGKTPTSLDLPFGTYQVKVVQTGYRTTSKSATLRVPDYTVSFQMEAEQVTGQVNLYGPMGFSVSVDGVERGTMPVTVQVAEGARTFKLSGPDGAGCTITRDIKFASPGRPATVTLQCP